MSRKQTGRTIREDAERYRWLRDRAVKGDAGPMAFYTTPAGDSQGVPLTGSKLDRAIDVILWDELEARLAVNVTGTHP